MRAEGVKWAIRLPRIVSAHPDGTVESFMLPSRLDAGVSQRAGR